MPAKKQRIVRVLNCIPSREIERDWKIDHALEAGVTARPPEIPPQKDLRENWWTIGDQGSTGSCVGWATADSVVRWHMVKAGWIQSDQKLSVRYVWMASKETDEFNSYPTTFIEIAGTSLKAALDVVRKFGVVQESILPFFDGKLYPENPTAFYAIAAKLKIASYYNLGTSPTDWKTWLANNGPILTRLDVDKTWDEVGTDGKLDVYQTETRRGGHAIALVGYTEDRFIVRNSWGIDNWGDNGFAYASIPYAQAAFTELYGVSL